MNPMDPKLTAAYVLKNFAGARLSRKARTTKTIVTLYDGLQSGDDVSDGYRWQTVCEPHACIIAHNTFEKAASHLSHPEEWCEVCMGNEPDPRKELGLI